LKAMLPAGKRAFGRAYAGWAYSAAFYRGELWRGMGFGSLEDFIRFWEDDFNSYDERDLLAMLWTWQHARFGFEELSRITARVVMMPCAQDMYFTEQEARLEAVMIPGAQVRVLDSPYGQVVP
jgi:homoserine O-acetyltransferase